MAIQTEVWARDIAANLFPNDTFLMQSIDDSVFVENKTVHLPQSGAAPTVQRNPTSFPLTGAQRTDTDASYDLAEYVTTPTIVRDIEEIETSFQKRISVLVDHNMELNRQISDWMAHDWSPTAAANFVRTTGADRTAHVAGATGTRKKLQLADLLSAKRLLDNMDLPEDGQLNALVSGEMYNDLLEIDKILSAEYNLSGRIPGGAINQVFGLRFFKRSYAISYSNAATPVIRTPGAAALTTANAGLLIWHSRFVRRAKGSVKVFADQDNPLFTGSIFSVMARAGGRKAYNDQRGVVAIIEAAGA
jgi:hypothetical protein